MAFTEKQIEKNGFSTHAHKVSFKANKNTSSKTAFLFRPRFDSIFLGTHFLWTENRWEIHSQTNRSHVFLKEVSSFCPVSF